MKKSIGTLAIMLSFSAFSADITTVNTGDNISSVKMNELINELNTTKKLVPNIGSVETSFLPLSSFQKLNGSCWVLANGGSIIGSDYGNFLASEGLPVVSPDMRSTVPRMKDNAKGLNPDGDLALGSYQADAYLAHRHLSGTRVSGGNVEAAYANQGTTPGASGARAGGETGSSTNLGLTSTVGGNETRAKSTTVNYFIKINKVCNFL